MALSNKSHENNFDIEYENTKRSNQELLQSSLSLNDFRSKRVTFTSINFDNESPATSSSTAKSKLNSVERKQGGILLKKNQSNQDEAITKEQNEKDEKSSRDDLFDKNIKIHSPRTLRVQSASNRRKIYEKLNDDREKFLKSAIEDKRSTRKLLNKAKNEIKHFKFYRPITQERLGLVTNLDSSESKLKEIRYGSGRFGIVELMEEKATKQSDKSPRENQDSQIEHYIIERITAVNIDSRKLIFKKKR